MNRNLLILGAGQYGLMAGEIARAMGCFDSIDFLDDNKTNTIGKLQDYKHLMQQYDSAFVAIGNAEMRLKLLQKLEAIGYQIPVLQHPTAVVMPSAHVEKGCIVEALVVINANTVVHSGCIISAGAIINHNSEIGVGCHIDCGAIVPSNCSVPEETKLSCGEIFRK